MNNLLVTWVNGKSATNNCLPICPAQELSRQVGIIALISHSDLRPGIAPAPHRTPTSCPMSVNNHTPGANFTRSKYYIHVVLPPVRASLNFSISLRTSPNFFCEIDSYGRFQKELRLILTANQSKLLKSKVWY